MTRDGRLVLWVGAFALLSGSGARAALGLEASRQAMDWAIPAEATNLKSPLPSTPAVLKHGASVFESRCRPCHGPEGKGNGPLSDPAHPAADLTAGVKADLAPDGVLFYRVWNGKRPMPAFKSELSQDDVWAVVEHVKTLKKKD